MKESFFTWVNQKLYAYTGVGLTLLSAQISDVKIIISIIAGMLGIGLTVMGLYKSWIDIQISKEKLKDLQDEDQHTIH